MILMSETCRWFIISSAPGTVTVRSQCGQKLFFNETPNFQLCPICRKHIRIHSSQNPYKKINPDFLTRDGFMDQWTAFLTTIRGNSCLNWAEISRKTGISHAQVYNWTALRTMPSAVDMLKVTDAFEANVYDIFDNDDTDTLTEVSDDI